MSGRSVGGEGASDVGVGGVGGPSTSRIMMFSLSFLFHRQATLPKCTSSRTPTDPPVTWISWGDNEEASPQRRARRGWSSASKRCGPGGYFGNPSRCFSSGQRRGARSEGEIGERRRGRKKKKQQKEKHGRRRSPAIKHLTRSWCGGALICRNVGIYFLSCRCQAQIPKRIFSYLSLFSLPAITFQPILSLPRLLIVTCRLGRWPI